MKKIITICFVLALIVSCKKVDVDFTYTPTEPKAGETINFTNNSSSGESWAWTFGDNSTSLSKNPSKVYKKPGEYMVTLMVDSAKHQTCSKMITVYDTIPTFVASSDSILLYHNVTFRANIYNPFNYQLTYDWTLPNNCVLVAGNKNSAAIELYFTSAGMVNLQLAITQKDKTYPIEQSFEVQDVKAPSIVMRKTDNTVMRQRIINDRFEQPSHATSLDVLCAEQTTDTVVTFNGMTYYASQIANTVAGFNGLDISRIQIDAMAQKWYIATSEGLMVANFNGSERVVIDANATGAIYVDANRNRLYWATSSGLYAMPLVKSKNNQFTSTPEQYNSLSNIDLITVNNTPQ